MHQPPRDRTNIGFVSFRFAGTDGVSLESFKWAEVLTKMGYRCHFFGGDLETPDKRSQVVPKAHFLHPEIREIYDECFTKQERPRTVTRRIHEIREELKEELYGFLDRFDIGILVAENALTIPLNLPLGMALTEVIAETGIPTIGHHHDFFWERKRFLTNCCWDILRSAYPPRLQSIRHVVINSSGQNQLALRTGATATLIPNVMNFEAPVPEIDDYNRDLRSVLGVADDHLFALQPTRVVQRKGIEHAIELMKRLDRPGTLVISHASGDEGYQYERRVREYAELLGVRALFMEEIVENQRGTTDDGRKIYCLDDLYRHADLVTYPSIFEGFGNAFLEAVYHRRPIMVNNYSIYAYDIKPQGFTAIEIDDYVTDDAVEAANRFLDDDGFRQRSVDRNFDLGRKLYGYEVLEARLSHVLTGLWGGAIG